MDCSQSTYVVGLSGAEVGKANNKWKTCKQRWEITDNDNKDWCLYDCNCTAACEQVMGFRWPKSLCDVFPHFSSKASLLALI